MMRFRMFRITTEQFALLSDQLPGDDQLSLNREFEFFHSEEEPLVAIGVRYQLSANSRDLLVIQLRCEFVFHAEDWEAATKEGETTIPKETLDYLLSQSVGVVRGTLHAKTEGTPFQAFVLPPQDVSEVVTEALVIKRNQ